LSCFFSRKKEVSVLSYKQRNFYFISATSDLQLVDEILTSAKMSQEIRSIIDAYDSTLNKATREIKALTRSKAALEKSYEELLATNETLVQDLVRKSNQCKCLPWTSSVGIRLRNRGSWVQTSAIPGNPRHIVDTEIAFMSKFARLYQNLCQ